MHRTAALILLHAACAFASDFNGERALEYARRAVEFGPRPPGSPAIASLQGFILRHLKSLRCQVTEDDFVAGTPRGPVRMKNILATFPGASGRWIVVSGHYDTKILPFRFVGANDGGSSTGFLMELARTLSGKPRRDTVVIALLDGEEAFVQWSERDSLYGSRHLASLWERSGVLRRIRALINVDMIGDRDLGIQTEVLSTPWLRQLVWRTARELGYERYFLSDEVATEDDHLPFLQKGVPAVNLIDFRYGGSGNRYWHTAEDTIDKLSAASFQIVGDVVLRVLTRLEEDSSQKR
jgi:Zn-dependent M28 family amino/carboxypeptidase